MRETYTPEFEAFWSIYPRRISKKGAFVAFQRAMRDGVEVEDILKAVETYKKWLKSDGWKPEPKHPATWLNMGCWDDEYDLVEEKPQISFKLSADILQKLRGVSLADSIIKRWFDDANFVDNGQGIIFASIFMRDYVKQNYDGHLRRAFGFMPELGIVGKAA